MAAVPSIGRARAIEQTSHAPGARLTERLYEHHYHRVFGFCLYELAHSVSGQPNLTVTLLLPLVVYLVLRWWDGTLKRNSSAQSTLKR